MFSKIVLQMMVITMMAVMAVFAVGNLSPNSKTIAAMVQTDIAGGYTFVGDAGNGKTYQGTAQISKEGDTYIVRWTTAAGQRYTGVGIKEGNTFSVAIHVDGEQGYLGIAVYKIEDRQLSGRWTVMGAKGKTLTETMTPVRY